MAFNKKSKVSEEKAIHIGQVSETWAGYEANYDPRWVTTDLLQRLTGATDKYAAIDIIINETPEGKSAFNTYLRLSNQGINVKLKDMRTGRYTRKYDAELREFLRLMGGTSADGLDGFIDQLHASSTAHGGMAVEVVVSKNAHEVEKVLIIDPKTITFEFDKETGQWAAYQNNSDGQRRNLYDGNFFWIPNQPIVGTPIGTLQFEPAIATMTTYYQVQRDLLAYMQRMGFPKYDVVIDTDKAMASAPSSIMANPEKRAQYMNDMFSKIRNNMSNIHRDSNIIHFDSVKVNVIGAGENNSGIDIRALNEAQTPGIVNSFALTPVMMGRLKSGSYSLGTAEYKMVKDTIEVRRRGSKRMVENVVNIWARVTGKNVRAVATHNPIEWQIIEDKYKAKLLQVSYAKKAEDCGYTDHDAAANMALGEDANAQKVVKAKETVEKHEQKDETVEEITESEKR